jgi:uncharacterized protein (DUF924 family)
MTNTINEIHEFWFGELDSAGLCITDRNGLWFSADPQTDETCRNCFGDSLTLALAGKLDKWQESDRGLIALVVLLDQFSRNMHRGTAQAFAGDTRALALAQETITAGRHLHLPAIHRASLYLPLEHCEDLTVQETCVALFEELARFTDHPLFASSTRYALAHRDVIEKFGRFPHRNAILGRQSSNEELDYLEQHGGF